MARLVLLLQWAPRYERAWLRPDLIADLTVAALVVPKSLGYAGIAGVPIQYGLYAAAASAILCALLGTSRQIATGPSSALAAVAYADQTERDHRALVQAVNVGQIVAQTGI